MLATSLWLYIATVDPENHGVRLRLDKHLHHHFGGGTPKNQDQTSHRGRPIGCRSGPRSHCHAASGEPVWGPQEAECLVDRN